MARTKISLEDFAQDLEFKLSGEDSISKYINRARICNMALTGLRELNLDLGGYVKSVRIQIDTSTETIDFPEDFIDYTKIGVLDDNCQVQYLGRNDKINLSGDFLLDGSGGKLLDSDGIEITTATECTGQNLTESRFSEFVFYNYYQNGSVGQLYGVPTGNNSRGSYRVDYDNNQIKFQEGVVRDYVILEYIADESMKANPMIPVDWEETLRYYVYYQLIRGKRNVGVTEKRVAKDDFLRERKRAARRFNSPTVYEIIQAARTGSKQTLKF